MLYMEKFAVCSQIQTKHTKYAVGRTQNFGMLTLPVAFKRLMKVYATTLQTLSDGVIMARIRKKSIVYLQNRFTFPFV